MPKIFCPRNPDHADEFDRFTLVWFVFMFCEAYPEFGDLFQYTFYLLADGLLSLSMFSSQLVSSRMTPRALKGSGPEISAEDEL